MITKEEFVEIIERLRETNDIIAKINKLVHESKEAKMNDYMNVGQLMICHEDIVVKLLGKLMNLEYIEHIGTELSWWIYETDYGRDKKRNWIEINGKKIKIATAEKMYDYLMAERKDKNEQRRRNEK